MIWLSILSHFLEYAILAFILFGYSSYNGQFWPPFSFTPYIGGLDPHFPSPRTLVEIVSRKSFFFPLTYHI
jgi:hypothetical protein